MRVFAQGLLAAVPTRLTAWRITAPFLAMMLTLAGCIQPEDAISIAGTGDIDGEGDPIELTGKLTVVYMDDFDKQVTERQYLVEDKQSKKKYKLKFKDTPPGHLRTGTEVSLHGKANGKQIILAADDIDASNDVSVPSTAAVTGEQNTLVMVANFNNAAVSCPINDIRDLMFTDPADQSIDDLYQEISFGAAWLTGQVVGPYNIDFNTGTCDLDGWSDAADEAARAEGIEPDSYDRKVYVLPPGGCSGAGYGTVLGNPTRAWILKCDFRDTYAHELGHNLGMAHASTPGCEYCDITDFMGTGNNKLRHNNAPHKDQLGWLLGGQIETITESGTYDIAPLEPLPADTLAPQALKLLKADTGEYYYLSYRRAIGFDTSLSPISQLDRLAVHRATGDGSGGNTYRLAQLTDGESYVDSVNGITFTVMGHNADYVTAEVTLDGSLPPPTCTVASPLVSLSPASQTAAAGSSLDYTVNVTNQDGAVCMASTFALTNSVPMGWTGTVSPASLNLGPGQMGTATFSVVSAAVATAASYNVSVTATDNTEIVHTATGNAGYTVADGCAPGAPGMSVSPSSQNADAGATLVYTVSLVNNDNAACSSSTFDLSIGSAPAGWSASLSSQSLNLGPGATGTASLSVTSAATALPGSYSVQVDTSDAQQAVHTGSVATTYVIDDIAPAGDAEPPTIPTGLSANANARRVNLSWSASNDNVGVVGYRVYRDGTLIASIVDTSYADRDGATGVTYAYTVAAYDAANNVSAMSAPVMATKGKRGRGKRPK